MTLARAAERRNSPPVLFTSEKINDENTDLGRGVSERTRARRAGASEPGAIRGGSGAGRHTVRPRVFRCRQRLQALSAADMPPGAPLHERRIALPGPASRQVFTR